MGSIWSVKKDHTEYALKVCEKTDEESLKRFKREYRLMQHLNHINVLKAFEFGFIDERPCFVMEKCEKSLEKQLNKGFQQKKNLTLFFKSAKD